MTWDRPYHKAVSIDMARLEIAQNSGKQFDPRVVDAFLTISELRLQEIRGSTTQLLQLPHAPAPVLMAIDAAG